MFEANSDASTIVRRDLAYPLLTNELRLYIDSYSGSVTLAARMYGYAQGAIPKSLPFTHVLP